MTALFTVIIPVLLALVGVLFAMGCLGEKQLSHKITYAVAAFAFFVLLIIEIGGIA